MAFEYGVYALPADLKAVELKAESNKDDDLIKRYCFEASEDVRRLSLDRKFHPVLATEYYDYEEDKPGRIDLMRDLVEVTTFTTNNTDTTIVASSYFLKAGKYYNLLPARSIELKQDGATNQFNYSGTPQQANAVTGFWGYMPNWNEAWLDSGDTVGSFAGNTLTVSNVDGTDRLFNKPRFKEFQLLKIESGSDTEFMFVYQKNQAANTLEVERGVNGTSNIASPAGLIIYVWQPFDTIARYTRRLAAHYYRQRGNSRADADRPIITPTGVVLPAEFPQEIQAAIRAYRWVGI